MLINGKRIDAFSGETFEVCDPSTNEVLTRVPKGEKKDINLAVKAARNAFENGPWRKITVSERESDDFRKKEIEWKNKDHALFVGYMPSEEPKYSISIIVEHGGSGSSTAAPIAKEIFNAIHRLRI